MSTFQGYAGVRYLWVCLSSGRNSIDPRFIMTVIVSMIMIMIMLPVIIPTMIKASTISKERNCSSGNEKDNLSTTVLALLHTG